MLILDFLKTKLKIFHTFLISFDAVSIITYAAKSSCTELTQCSM